MPILGKTPFQNLEGVFPFFMYLITIEEYLLKLSEIDEYKKYVS